LSYTYQIKPYLRLELKGEVTDLAEMEEGQSINMMEIPVVIGAKI